MRIIETKFNRDVGGFGQLLNLMSLTGPAVEVGSAYGGHARKILETWEGSQLSLVDLWARQPSEVYREDTSTVDYDLWFNCCKKLEQEDRRVRLIRSSSVDAAPLFEDRSLDFVYIDANHSLEAVLADLNAWGRKVRGILAGHDFHVRIGGGHYSEVELALEEFLPKEQTVFLGTCSSWWTFFP